MDASELSPPSFMLNGRTVAFYLPNFWCVSIEFPEGDMFPEEVALHWWNRHPDRLKGGVQVGKDYDMRRSSGVGNYTVAEFPLVIACLARGEHPTERNMYPERYPAPPRWRRIINKLTGVRT